MSPVLVKTELYSPGDVHTSEDTAENCCLLLLPFLSFGGWDVMHKAWRSPSDDGNLGHSDPRWLKLLCLNNNNFLPNQK